MAVPGKCAESNQYQLTLELMLRLQQIDGYFKAPV